MVITSAQVLETYRRKNIQLLPILERKIDRALAKEFVPGEIDGVCVASDDLDSQLISELKSRYRAAGWCVAFESDPSGEYLRFTARRSVKAR